MTHKPSYEELEKRIEGLEKEVLVCKRVKEALRESQQMFHSVLDTIPVRVFWKDLDSNFLGCNRPFACDAGLQAPEEIVGRNDFEIGWREHAEYRSDDRLMIETGRLKLNYEEAATTPGGQRVWLRKSKVPLVDGKGEIKGVLGVYEDITVHKRAEEALRKAHGELELRVEERTAELIKVNEALKGEILERDQVEAAVRQSEEKYRQLFETVSDAIHVCDGETRKFIDVNERALGLFGYSCDEFLELKHSAITAEPEQSEVCIKETLAGMRTQVPLRYLRKKDGTVFPAEISCCAFVVAGSKVLCSIVRDITERRRAEQELSAKTRSLQEFNATLRVLLQQREEDRTELEESIMLNVNSQIVPYVEKLKKSRLDGGQMTCLTVLESHVRQITSPFTRRLFEKYLGLSPVEVQVAGLIKEGKTTKEIAELLCVSENTVSSNRFHIRKKLGLSHKKVNLRYYLKSLEK